MATAKTEDASGGILEGVLRTIRDRRAAPQRAPTRRSCLKAGMTRSSRKSRKKREKY